MNGGGSACWALRRRRASRLAATLLGLLVGGFALAPPAAAAGSTTTAYWWMPEPVTGLIAVPGVPNGGMYVASSPSGPQAISALRITGWPAGAVLQVTLQVAQRQVVNPPAITAYRAASSWQAGGPQAWSAKPAYDRRSLGIGHFDIAQTRMVIDLPAGALGDGVVLAPTPTPGASASATFAIAFDAPTQRDVRLFVGPATRPTHAVVASHTPSHQPSAAPRRTHHRHPTRPLPSPGASRVPGPRSPSTRATSSTPALPAANAAVGGSGHGTRNLVLVLVVVVVVVVVLPLVVVVLRRRQVRGPGPPND